MERLFRSANRSANNGNYQGGNHVGNATSEKWEGDGTRRNSSIMSRSDMEKRRYIMQDI